MRSVPCSRASCVARLRASACPCCRISPRERRNQMRLGLVSTGGPCSARPRRGLRASDPPGPRRVAPLGAGLLLVGLVLLARGVGAALLPDLTLDTDTLRSSVAYGLISFTPTDCELQAADLCVGGPGARRLLRFSVFTPNIGAADLVVGVPQNELDVQLCDPGNVNCVPKWMFSTCHNHYHFETFARYELR